MYSLWLVLSTAYFKKELIMIIFLEGGWEGERLSLREYSSFPSSLYAYTKLLYSEVAAENATSTYITYSWLIFDNTGHYM